MIFGRISRFEGLGVPSRPSSSPLHAGKRAFTVLELVIAVAIVGVLATLLIPSMDSIRDRIEKVACIGHLRSIYSSLNAYVIDHRRWPQLPENEEIDKARMEQFWIDTLEPYHVSGKVWFCPSLKRRYNEDPSQYLEIPRIHYIPGQFDDNPATPHRWPAQPWVIEVGSMHGRGNLLIRSDGGIREIEDLLEEMQQAAP